ncbi:serine/threonine protein kinase [Chondromyces apiculatus]|uniref:Putative serine/threonine protein kinase n=1 Tax=Chondromyces apiculatus DSM 436 TaxID=1192034 RepID=A0A017T7K9_9BACT|nr:protein kinase [Chondromyces apiculatus]EYF04967.1 putative serine/threonine protein kinase [Chondromyces apiculatus DSM 436]
MITILRDDEALDELLGASLTSGSSPGIHYQMMRRAGVGTMFASFYALRVAPEGESPVVVKILRPSFSRQLGATAEVVVRKEAESLRRLNERVPPTPFVVRLIDTGSVDLHRGMRTQTLPWVTIEYVHGGSQGTTLTERVESTIEFTGSAFDPARAMRAVECMAAGLTAVHEVGVIHRDLTPERILCCGAGVDEVFKISEFGLARPQGVKETLGIGVIEMDGVRPVELLSASKEVGPWTDLFGLAGVVYFLLTGEPLFPQRRAAEILGAVTSRNRRSVLEGRWLHPALRSQESACKSIDLAIRWATAPAPDERLQEAESLAAMLVPYLKPVASVPLLAVSNQTVSAPPQPSQRPPAAPPVMDLGPARPGPSWLRQTIQVRRGISGFPSQPVPAPAPLPPEAEDYGERMTIPSMPPLRAPLAPQISEVPPPPTTIPPLSALDAGHATPVPEVWRWSVLNQRAIEGVVRSVGWDGYGRCLAATSAGLLFWNGTSWSVAESGRLLRGRGIHFVQRVSPGKWLVGGDGATLATYTTGGVANISQREGAVEHYLALSGDDEDIGVLASAADGAPIMLQTFIGKRWMRAFEVEGMAHLSGLARIGDDQWLVVGRGRHGRGMIARYVPLEWYIETLPAPDVRAFLASAAMPELGLGLVTGVDGTAVWYHEGMATAETVDARFDLSAVALSHDGTAWAASARRIWCRTPAPPGAGTWTCVWQDDNAMVPIVSLFVDSGVALVVTADGGVLEGRPS